MAKKTVVEETEAELEIPKKGPKPDFRVVQTERGPEGETKYRNIVGMLKKTSKSGNDFYSMSIGKLRLLVFPNKKAE